MGSTLYYLSHHGIDGQKWGKRNGPPYPLNPGQHSAEEKRKNPHLNKGTTDSNKKKSLPDKAKAYIKRKLRGEITDKEKENIIRKGDLSKAQKHYKQFSKEDIERLIDRNYSLNKINSAKVRNDAAVGKKQVNDYIKTMNTINDIMKPTIAVGRNIVDGYNLTVGVYNTFNPNDQKKYIFTGGKKDKKGN